MTFAPDTAERLARARSDLRTGLPIVIDACMLVFATETIAPQRFAELMAFDEPPVLVITDKRAATLKARAYDGDLARIILPKGADMRWLDAVSNPETDLAHPMKGPFQTQRDGDVSIHRTALRLVKSARLLPAILIAPIPDTHTDLSDLTHLSSSDANRALNAASALHPVVNARVPLAVSEAGRLHVFRPDDGGEEHYAVEIGRPDRSAPVLTRLHSACFTGDLLGSLKCDCGPQLNAALRQMGETGSGVLLYLNQEGRGIGLANKMRAYALQDQGFDTVEANHRLGFEDDERDFRLGAEILKTMGFTHARLMTNNPAKIDMLTRCGLTVTERVPLKVGQTAQNADYLKTKADKSGHLL